MIKQITIKECNTCGKEINDNNELKTITIKRCVNVSIVPEDDDTHICKYCVIDTIVTLDDRIKENEDFDQSDCYKRPKKDKWIPEIDPNIKKPIFWEKE